MTRQHEDVLEALSVLEAHPDFKVLRRVSGLPEMFSLLDPKQPIKKLLVLDLETTGLDVRECAPIEVSLAQIEFQPSTGLLGRVLKVYDGLEDPGVPLTEDIIKVTGLTDEDLAGKHFDDETVRDIVKEADLLLSHNAGFDRPFFEKRWPGFESKWWACSFKEGPWKELGIGSAKQEFIGAMLCGLFYDAHRASVDVAALTWILAHRVDPAGKPVLSSILAKASQPTYRIWATGAPFEVKDTLKSAGYRWSGEADKDTGALKAWYMDGLDKSAFSEQLKWLTETVPNMTATVDRMNGQTRHSNRPDFQREKIELTPGTKPTPSKVAP